MRILKMSLPLCSLALIACGGGGDVEVPVNATFSGDQLRPDVLALEDGFLVVFGDLSQTAPDTILSAVRLRRFDERGFALDEGDVVANSSALGAQNFPRGARAGDGNLLLVWEEAQGSSDDISGDAIRGRIFGADATPQGNDLLIPSTTQGNQRSPAVACGDTVCLVVWEDNSGTPPDDASVGIRGRLISSSGAPLGNDFLINQSTEGDQTSPTVASLGAAGFVVAWGSPSGDGNGGAVLYRLVSLQGELLGDEQVAADIVAGNQLRPEAAANQDFFVLVWEDSSADADGGIRGRAFDLSGSPRGGSFVVNTTTSGLQSFPVVAISPKGDFLVAWRESSPADGQEIRARRFSADLSPQEADFIVNSIPDGDQTTPRAAALNKGFVVVFEDASEIDDPEPRGIRAAILR